MPTFSDLKMQLDLDMGQAELVQKKAETYAVLADAMTKLTDLNIDIAPLLVQFKLKSLGIEDSIGLRAYHVQYGLLTLNEARARIGLPSLPNGDKLLPGGTAPRKADDLEPEKKL